MLKFSTFFFLRLSSFQFAHFYFTKIMKRHSWGIFTESTKVYLRVIPKMFGSVWLCLFLKSTLYANSDIKRKKTILVLKIYFFNVKSCDYESWMQPKQQKKIKSRFQICQQRSFSITNWNFFENVYLKNHKFWAVTTNSKCHCQSMFIRVLICVIRIW